MLIMETLKSLWLFQENIKTISDVFGPSVKLLWGNRTTLHKEAEMTGVIFNAA